MKRILFALFVLSVFLTSMLPVSAVNESEGVVENTVEVNKTEAAEGSGEDTEAPMIRYRERLQERSEDFKERLEDARERYQIAKENYINAREKYFAQKEKFIQTRDRLRVCKEKADCEELKEKAKDDAKSSLSRMTDMILESLEKIKAKVEANEDLSEEEQEEMLAELDERTTAVTDAKQTVEESENRTEVLEATRLIKAEWTKTKPVLRKVVDRIVNARIGGIIVQTERLDAKLERVINGLEDKGYDVSEAKEIKVEFSEKVEEAKSNHESAKESFKEDSPTEGNRYMKEAHQNLKDARVLLRDLVKSIKETGNGETALEVEEEA